ncbi:MAG TPA: glycoside hydrolase family 5 protein [Polyangiaceae bacterium]|nr:glycoside hydrolase family 5 protein [Polyangiaceae bacterium]
MSGPLSGCGASDPHSTSGGGNTSSGGSVSLGGATSGAAAGGAATTGGDAGSTPNTGGTTSGGQSSVGGNKSNGGAFSTGGAAPGGAPTGGTSGTGGGVTGGAATGGASTGGASTGGASTGGASTGGGGAGGRPSAGGAATGGLPTGGANNAGGLPRLTVNGNKLQDPTGKTIVLRGSSLIDIGSLYAYFGKNTAAITSRIDKIAAAGVQGHVVRVPVYPKIDYNGGVPTCSPTPYPVGSGPAASCTPTAPLTATDYYALVLKPVVDYATSKNLYVIIDFHQIDNATTGTSAADATTFWTDIAPKFKDYANVFYEPFNEPIDNTKGWSALKPVVQGWVTTIRNVAPNNIIIVPSNGWDQKPGDAASDPPTGGNLMYTAHIYPSNWNSGFQNQVTTAASKAPVFTTEWGYGTTDANYATWGTDLQAFVNNSGASWTAWVTDNAWTPSMFSDKGMTQLTHFGSLVKSWLAAKAASDWVF